MKEAMLVFVYTLSIFSLLAQQSSKVSILNGEEQKVSKKYTLSDIIGYDATGIYTLMSNSRWTYKLVIAHYNNKMNPTKSSEINLEHPKYPKRQFDDLIKMKDNIYIFSTYIDRQNKKNILLAQSIDKTTLRLNNDIKQIAVINFENASKRNSGYFDYSLSNDESKLLVYYSTPYQKREKESFGFHVFDQNMNQIWEEKVTLPYQEELFGIERYKVGNKGGVYLLGTLFQEKIKIKRNGKPNYKYVILSYTDKGVQEYPIQLTGKFITDMQIAITDNQDIFCAGFYSDMGTFSIKGSYFITINGQTGEVAKENHKEFGINFITQNMTLKEEKKTKKKVAKGKNVELYQYDLDEIILRKDGGAYLIGEQYYVRVLIHTHTDANGHTHTTRTYIYYYNDILTVSISPNGEIDWTEKIAKKQVTRNDGGYFSSYTRAIVDDQLYFIFNDNAKNLFYKSSGKLYNYTSRKEANVVLVGLTTSGKKTKEELYKTQDVGITIRPKICKQISDDEVILFSEKKKAHLFSKLTFKD